MSGSRWFCSHRLTHSTMGEDSETIYWAALGIEQHRKRLTQIKPTFTTFTPVHSIDTQKRLLARAAQAHRIEQDNIKMVSRMMNIVKKAGSEYHPPPPKKLISWFEADQKRIQKKIDQDNYVRSTLSLPPPKCVTRLYKHVFVGFVVSWDPFRPS